LEELMRAEGIRAATLRASVPTHKREAWYREQLRRGVDVALCHPKIVETGLDLFEFPAILFHETGYSLHTLRQASRRSWRIGQRRPVDYVEFDLDARRQQNPNPNFFLKPVFRKSSPPAPSTSAHVLS
jgi:hypothetical protein